MTFIVTARSPTTGGALVACDSPAEALATAARLARTGHVDVLIADAQGAQYRPEAFARAARS